MFMPLTDNIGNPMLPSFLR
uniref:Uncharacterized protein n=1 Tax=Arundo donax TaxID=35708 RepID=A0A0A8Z0A7_ARUDO